MTNRFYLFALAVLALAGLIALFVANPFATVEAQTETTTAQSAAPAEPAPPAGGDTAAIILGGELTTLYCADCHATGRTGESKLPIAPKFRDLHKRYDVELLEEALVEGIVTAHPTMPEFEFDPDQAEAIVRYLKSLEN